MAFGRVSAIMLSDCVNITFSVFAIVVCMPWGLNSVFGVFLFLEVGIMW